MEQLFLSFLYYPCYSLFKNRIPWLTLQSHILFSIMSTLWFHIFLSFSFPTECWEGWWQSCSFHFWEFLTFLWLPLLSSLLCSIEIPWRSDVFWDLFVFSHFSSISAAQPVLQGSLIGEVLFPVHVSSCRSLFRAHKSLHVPSNLGDWRT